MADDIPPPPSEILSNHVPREKNLLDLPAAVFLGPLAESFPFNFISQTPLRDLPESVASGLLELSPAADVRDISTGAGLLGQSAINLNGGQFMQGAEALGFGLLGVLTGGQGGRAAKAATGLIEDVGERLARAREQGFRTEAPIFSGTDADFRAFDTTKRGQTSGSQAAQAGVFASFDPETANEFAELAARRAENGAPNVIPMVFRSKNPASLTLDGSELDTEVAATLFDAFDQGFDSVMLRNYTTPSGKTGKTILVVKDPAQLRSIFAKFDPRKLLDNDLSASVVPISVFLTGAGLASVDRQQ